MHITDLNAGAGDEFRTKIVNIRKRVCYQCPKHRIRLGVEGKKFNKWTVVSINKDKKGEGQYLAYCECSPDILRSVSITAVKSGRSSSCGCDKERKRKATKREVKRDEIVGTKKGKLTALELMIKDNDRVYIRCLCDCNRETTVRIDGFESGTSASCGNCGFYRNGVRTSKFVINLEKFLLDYFDVVHHNFDIPDTSMTRCNVDIYIPEINMIIEYDNLRFHSKKKRVETDKKRTAEILKKGYNLLRVITHNVKVKNQDILDKITSFVGYDEIDTGERVET